MRHALAWLVVLPVVGAGTLVAHAIAYTVTGTPVGDTHAYLAHAPQALLAVFTAGVIGTALAGRVRAPSSRPFPVVALLAFALLEHVEALAHGGELPMVVSSPSFLVGLALQGPVALVAWLLARWIMRTVATGASTRPPRRVPRYDLPWAASGRCARAEAVQPLLRTRGPPALLRP